MSVSTGSPSAQAARKQFWATLAATLLLKLWLAAAFPFTGDEAFFYQWGVHPDWGYYDHPPMVGWLLALLSAVSHHPLVLRIATVALWTLIAFGILDLLRRYDVDDAGAYWLAALFLTMPFTWGLNFVTTDTPLVAFVFLSGYCFLRGVASDRLPWFAASGAFLGLALLSKYFAVLLGVAYFASQCTSRKGWARLLLVAGCAAPAAALHLAYNATHCWNNVMFNLVNRHEGTRWSFSTVALYLGMLAALLTPWVAWALVRGRGDLRRRAELLALFGVPFGVFLLVSARKTIGLHWVLAFLPFAFVALGVVTPALRLQDFTRWTRWWALPVLLALASVVAVPLSAWRGTALHDPLVFHKETGQIVAALRSGLPSDGVVMARGYSPAAILSYHSGSYVPVFGPGRHHARQDDILVDFRRLAGRHVRIFDRGPINTAELQPFFSSVTVSTFTVAGTKFWYADGLDFDYDAYRRIVLAQIADRFYRIPAFLPRHGCPFLERYDL